MGHHLSKDEKEELSGELRIVLQDEYSTLRKDMASGFKEEIDNVQKTLTKEYSTLRTDMTNGFRTEINVVQKTLETQNTTRTKKVQKELDKFSKKMETQLGDFQIEFSGLKEQLQIFTDEWNKHEKIKTEDKPKEEKKSKKENGGVKGWYMLLASTTLLLVAASMLISSSVQISKVKPCELETALDYISMEYSPHPCKYNSIREYSSNLRDWGIADFLLHWFLFWAILYKCQCRISDNIGYIIMLITAIVAVVFFIGMIVIYVYIVNEEEKETVLDFLQLESSMKSWLVKHYKSDNISNGEAVSIAWNMFFIRYDCCGISEVVGTTNDFDNTPWCTTSGSCQATSSQIPKTCCRGVTKDDYQNAPTTCHASVNDGTYKSSCISRMKSLGRDNINESQLTTLSLSMLTLLLLQGTELFLLAAMLICICKENSTVDATEKRSNSV